MGEQEHHPAGHPGTVNDTLAGETQDEIRLRQMAMDAAGVGTWFHDLKTDITFGDATTIALFHFDRHYVPVKEMIEAIFPEDQPLLEEAVNRAIQSESGKYSIDYRIVWPDHSIHWISVKGEVIREAGTGGSQPVRIMGVVMDITARKAAEAALQESQERLSLVIEASGIGLWDWDILSGKVIWSDRCLKLFGLSPETCMSYDVFLEAVHPEDREQTARAVQTALESRGTYRAEIRTLWPDGSLHWVLASGRGYYGRDGRPIRMSGTAFDITERKNAETALAESESLLRSMFQAALDPVLFVDNDGDCIEVNLATRDLFRSAGIDIKGKCLFSLLSTDDFAPLWDVFLKEGRYRRRHEIPTAGPSKLLIEIYGVASVLKNRHLFVLHDITQQDILLREHETQRHFLDQVIDTVPALVWISSDPACRTMTGNKAAYQALRMPPGVNISESVRTSESRRAYAMCRDGKQIPPQDLPMQRAAALNQQVVGIEFDIVYEDGSALHFIGNAAPLHDEDGNVRGAVGVFMDITYRREYEQHLKALADELERSNKNLEQFAYVVSHDLQEPLRQVVRFGEILHQRYRQQLDSSAVEFLEFIVAGGKRMQRLIKDLLAYSRVQRGGLERTPVSLQEILEAAMLNLRGSINYSGAVITNDPLPVLYVDRVQFVQVFQNLLGNAIKFRGEAAPKIHIGAKKEQAGWVFCVQDNGIGFD